MVRWICGVQMIGNERSRETATVGEMSQERARHDTDIHVESIFCIFDTTRAVLRLVWPYFLARDVDADVQVGHTSTRWCCQPVDSNGNYVKLWGEFICLHHGLYIQFFKC